MTERDVGGVQATDLQLPPWRHMSASRREHVARMAALVNEWAYTMGVPNRERLRWLRAVALHDALKDAPVDLLRVLAPNAWSTDSLRHGPAAARHAERDGETDQGVLDAVRYHSVGYASWDAVGKILYLADYLEPGRRDVDGRNGERRAQVPHDLEGVLREVAAVRIRRALRAGRALLPETVAFWNDLVAAS